MHIRQLEKQGFASVCVAVNIRIGSYILNCFNISDPFIIVHNGDKTEDYLYHGARIVYFIKTLKGKTRNTATKTKLMTLTAKCFWMDDKISEDVNKIVNRTVTGQNFDI
jgi:hypothetical protein